MASSSQYPFWILDVANNQLGTNIFQLSLPLRPLSHKFVVGDAQTARDILMDDKSTKPMDIYGHMRNLNYRVSLFTTGTYILYKRCSNTHICFLQKIIHRVTQVCLH